MLSAWKQSFQYGPEGDQISVYTRDDAARTVITGPYYDPDSGGSYYRDAAGNMVSAASINLNEGPLLTWAQRALLPYTDPLRVDTPSGANGLGYSSLYGPANSSTQYTAAVMLAQASSAAGLPNFDFTVAARLAMPSGGWLLGANPVQVYNAILDATGIPVLSTQKVATVSAQYAAGAASGVSLDAQNAAQWEVMKQQNAASDKLMVLAIGAVVTAGVASAYLAPAAAGTETAGGLAVAGTPAVSTGAADLAEGTFFSLSPAAADTAIAGQAVWGAVDTVAAVGAVGNPIVDTGTSIGDATQVQAMTGQFTEASGAYTASAGSSLFDLGKQAVSIAQQVKSGAGALATIMGIGGAHAVTATPNQHLTTPTIYATNPDGTLVAGESNPAALVKQYWPLLAVAALALALKG